MAGKRVNTDAAAGFFDDITPARDVPNVQPVQNVPLTKSGKPDKRFTRTLKEKSGGRETAHVHALLFADDLDALKEIAYRQRKSTNELIREILTEYVQKNRE